MLTIMCKPDLPEARRVVQRGGKKTMRDATDRRSSSRWDIKKFLAHLARGWVAFVFVRRGNEASPTRYHVCQDVMTDKP